MKPLIRGDYRRIKVRFRRKGQAEFEDMTGGVVFFTMKKRQAAPYSEAEVRKRVPGTSTLTIIELQNEDTQHIEVGDYYYDIQFVDSERRPITIQKGRITVEIDITEVIE